MRSSYKYAWLCVLALVACGSPNAASTLPAALSERPALAVQPAAAFGYRTIYAFQGGRDGFSPRSGVTAYGGSLYGTTSGGGRCKPIATGCGTLYRLAPAGDTFGKTTLSTFGGSNRVLASPNGVSVFDGTLYGAAGSVNGQIDGLVFTISPAGSGYTVPYRFGSAAHLGTGLNGLIRDANGVLYTTTIGGGVTNPYACSNGCGYAVKLVPSGGSYKGSALYSFTGGTDGGSPVGSLVSGASGALFGVTATGGGSQCINSTCGTVYQLVPGAKGYTQSVLFAFDGTHGGLPRAGLIAGAGGTFYGTASLGGSAACECGVVYKLTPSGGTYVQSVVYSFEGGKDGYDPEAALVVGSHGVLYGTTFAGGAGTCAGHGCGTVFALTPKGAGYTESVLHRFGVAKDGTMPAGSLAFARGKLYGATTQGGPADAGTVFELTP